MVKRQRYGFKPHSNTRQQLRNLRNRCRHIIDSKDPAVITAGQRAIASVIHEPSPEFSALHLFVAALDISDECGEPWATCMNVLMDRFDQHERMTEVERVEIKPREEKGGHFLRRLLRALISRPLCAIDKSRSAAS